MRRIISLLALSLLLGWSGLMIVGALLRAGRHRPTGRMDEQLQRLQMVVGQGGANPLHLVIWQENGQWVGLAVDYRARSTTLITDVSGPDMSAKASTGL